jgi:hypothetical protein
VFTRVQLIAPESMRALASAYRRPTLTSTVVNTALTVGRARSGSYILAAPMVVALAPDPSSCVMGS